MINGRISSRSYPRYRLIRPFFRRVLADVDRFCMQSEESARRLIDLGADPARVTVTGSLKFDSLELPAPAAHGKPRERVLRFFRIVAEPHGDRRRQHDARRRGGRAARVRARSRRRCRARWRFSRRASRSGSARSSGSRATPGFVTMRAIRAADRRRAARRRRRARHDRRAGAALSAGDRGVRRRQPRRSRRPQHPRAGGVRQADRLRPAHAELHGDRRRVPRPTTRRCRCSPSASSTRRCSTLVTDPVRRARLGAAARALVEANRGAKDEDARGHRRAAAAAGDGRRASSVPSDWCIDRDAERGSTARRRRGAAGGTRATRRGGGGSTRPVVSVGNLRVGGSGKTPIVAYIARLLRRAAASGRRSSRAATRRRVARDGVTVVSDGTAVLADRRRGRRRAADAGARAARRRRRSSAPTAICPAVSPKRSSAPPSTSWTMGFSTSSWRATSICCCVGEDDLADRPLPAGRLREADRGGRRRRRGARHRRLRRGGRARSAARSASRPCSASRARIGAPRMIAGTRESVVVPPSSRVFVVTGIARPERFFADIAAAGWEIVGDA